MFRWITILALSVIVFTATGLHKFGSGARAAVPVQTIETAQSVKAECCSKTKEHKHSNCVAPYITAYNEGHFLNNQQYVILVFRDDSVQSGAPISPLKRPPKPVL